MAYPAGYWAELVRSSSSSSLVEDANGSRIWLRTSDGLPLEQQWSNERNAPYSWTDVVPDTDEPDSIEPEARFYVRYRFRKAGEAWLPSSDGLTVFDDRQRNGVIAPSLVTLFAGGSTYRFFEVPSAVAPSFTDNTGDAQVWMTGVDIDTITVPAATATPAATYAAVGTLPAGISFNTNTRQITGRPTSPGSGTITIRATNSQGSADWTVAYTTSSVQGAIKIGNTLIDFDLVGDLKIGTELVGGMKIGTELIYQVGDTTPTPHHTFTITTNDGGYNGVANRGSITNGTYTINSKSVTVVHCRNVRGELNFALSGRTSALTARDFPSRIVLTKTTGGEVEQTLGIQAGSFRRLSGGSTPANTWRQDYDPVSGNLGDIFTGNQTVRVQVFYG